MPKIVSGAHPLLQTEHLSDSQIELPSYQEEWNTSTEPAAGNDLLFKPWVKRAGLPSLGDASQAELRQNTRGITNWRPELLPVQAGTAFVRILLAGRWYLHVAADRTDAYEPKRPRRWRKTNLVCKNF